MKTPKLLLSVLLLTSLFQTSVFAVSAIAVGDVDPKAIDASTEQHFITSGHPSYDSAKAAALSQCLAKQLHFCQVAVWFDTCGAYAKSEKSSGNAWAATEDDAKRLALASCGKDCQIVVAQCERGTSK
jgi:hypothetical protein